MLHATMMGAMKASETLYTAPQSDPGYFISQKQILNLSLQEFCYYYAELACEVAHLDFSHTPTSKSYHRLIGFFRTHSAIHLASFSVTFHPLSHSSMNPVSYYVFGLRKIIT
jgi:hypothetical protein